MSLLLATKLRMLGKLRREKRKRSVLVPMQRRETAMRPGGDLFVKEAEFAAMAAAQDTKLKPWEGWEFHLIPEIWSALLCYGCLTYHFNYLEDASLALQVGPIPKFDPFRITSVLVSQKVHVARSATFQFKSSKISYFSSCDNESRAKEANSRQQERLACKCVNYVTSCTSLNIEIRMPLLFSFWAKAKLLISSRSLPFLLTKDLTSH